MLGGVHSESWVPACGFEWGETAGLGVTGFAMTRRSDGQSVVQPPAAASWLIFPAARTEDEWTDRRRVGEERPPAAFREFADLDPSDRTAVAAFAAANGLLGIDRVAHCRPPGPAIAQIGGLESTCPLTGEKSLAFQAESIEDWGEHIARVRAAVTLFELIRAKDRNGLKPLFRWSETGLSGPGIEFAWRYEPPGGVGGGWLMGESSSPADNVEDVARRWLWREVDRRLESGVGVRLTIGRDRQPTSKIVADGLLPSMWLQLHHAITGSKSFRQCEECRRWMEISRDEEGSTTRRRFCSDTCRVREWRRSKAAGEREPAGKPKAKRKKG